MKVREGGERHPFSCKPHWKPVERTLCNPKPWVKLRLE